MLLNSLARQDKRNAPLDPLADRAISILAGAKAPDGRTLIEILLSSILMRGEDRNKELKSRIETVLEKPTASNGVSLVVVHRRLKGKHFDIFVCGNDGQVHTARWSEGYLGSTEVNGWLCLPAPPNKKFPPGAQVSVLSRKPSQLDLFICGSDGHVYTTWWIADSGWHYTWRDIGGTFIPGSRIAAAARQQEKIDVFASAGDGSVYTCWWSRDARQWGGPLGPSIKGWENLGGGHHRKSAQAANVAVLSRGPQALEIFFCGDTGEICYKSWTRKGKWDKDWTTLGKSPLIPGGFITAISRHKEKIDLFACGSDGKIYTSWSVGSKPEWSGNIQGWKCLGGGFQPGANVSAVARASEQLDLNVVGMNGLVYHLGWNHDQHWGSWTEIGGCADPEGRLDGVAMDSSTLQIFLAVRKLHDSNSIEVFALRGEEDGGRIGFGNKEWKSLGTPLPQFANPQV